MRIRLFGDLSEQALDTLLEKCLTGTGIPLHPPEDGLLKSHVSAMFEGRVRQTGPDLL